MNEPTQRTDNSGDEYEEKDGVVYFKGSRPFESLEMPPEDPADVEDYDWAMQDPQVRQEYGGLVVAVRNRKVWGAGKNYRVAWERACQTPGCPSAGDLVFVVVPGPGPVPGERLGRACF